MQHDSFWDQRHNRVFAHGGWRIGRGVTLRGYSLLDDLVGQHSFFQLLCLSVLGYLPDERMTRWIEGSFMCLSFPDPRIWCNQIAALGGSSRCTPLAAITAGSLASHSSLYGPGTSIAACHFLLEADQALQQGLTIEAFLDAHSTRLGVLRAPGFSRPVANGDDRVRALADLARSLEFTPGKYEQAAWAIDAGARERGQYAINMLGFVAAFTLDRGISAESSHLLYSLCVNGGLHACYAETVDAPPGAFLPLKCTDIDYVGATPRKLPMRGEP